MLFRSGNICYRQIDVASAEEYYTKALQLRMRVLGDLHPEVAASFSNLGNLFYYYNDMNQAMYYYDKALKIRQSTLDPKHPALGGDYCSVALVYIKKGDLVNAKNMFKQALCIYSEHPKRYSREIEKINIIAANSNIDIL